MEMNKFYCCKGSVRNNYHSRNLIGHYHFWVISPRNLTLFNRLFLAGRRVWAGHETSQDRSQVVCPSWCLGSVARQHMSSLWAPDRDLYFYDQSCVHTSQLRTLLSVIIYCDRCYGTHSRPWQFLSAYATDGPLKEKTFDCSPTQLWTKKSHAWVSLIPKPLMVWPVVWEWDQPLLPG